MEAPTSVKKRKPNWTQDECLYLTRLVEENKHILRSKFGSGVTTLKKREVWKTITTKLNATGTVERSTEEIEKKWHNLHMKGKAELADFKKENTRTGGGKSNVLEISPLAEAVGNVIGLDNVSISGIEGATDTTALMIYTSEPSAMFSPSLLDNPAILAPHTVTLPAEIACSSIPCTEGSHYQSMPSDGEALEKTKLKLEIENIKLKNQYLKLKIAKLQNEN